jgi:hypothetical protein
MFSKITKISPRNKSLIETLSKQKSKEKLTNSLTDSSSNESSPRTDSNESSPRTSDSSPRTDSSDASPRENTLETLDNIYLMNKIYFLNILSVKLKNSTLPIEFQYSLKNILKFIILNYNNKEIEDDLHDFFNNELDKLITICDNIIKKYKIFIDNKIRKRKNIILLPFVGSTNENNDKTFETWKVSNTLQYEIKKYCTHYLQNYNYKQTKIIIENGIIYSKCLTLFVKNYQQI